MERIQAGVKRRWTIKKKTGKIKAERTRAGEDT